MHKLKICPKQHKKCMFYHKGAGTNIHKYIVWLLIKGTLCWIIQISLHEGGKNINGAQKMPNNFDAN